MRSLRPEIADCHSQSRSDLVLHVQIPGLDIGVLEVVINRGWGQSDSGGIAQRGAESGARSFRSRSENSRVSQRRVRRRASNQVRHWLIGQDGIACAEHGLSIFE